MGIAVSSNKLGGLNVALLVVTLLALLFGAYGYIRPQPAAEGGRSGVRANGPIDDDVASQRPGGTTAKQDPGPAPEKPKEVAPKPDTPKPDTPREPLPETVVASPTDKGEASIAGTVLNSAGAPVSGATIMARRSNLDVQPPVVDTRDPAASRAAVTEYLAQVQSQTRTARSSADGKFSFAGLDGSLAYDLIAVLEGVGRGQVDRVAAGDSATIILQPVSWLQGRVVGPQGAAISQFSVKTYRRNRQWEGREQVFFAQDGRFKMECGAGVMMVEVSAPGFTQGAAAEINVDNSGTEHQFTLSQAAVLLGVVRDKQGNPLANVRITTGPVDERWERGRWDGYNTNPEARTDSQGRYRFDSLSPKEYTFTAVYGEAREAKTLTLSVGNNTQDFALDAGVRVTVRLKDMRGNPVEAEQVWFLRKDGQWLQGERLPAREAGVVEFAGLRPDDYTLSINAGGYPGVRRQVKLQGAQQVIEIELPDGAMLSGKISSSSGIALGGVSVRLVKDGENENEAWGTGRWAQVQSDGSYRIGPVEPGLWSIDVMGQDWKKVGGEKRNLVAGDNKLDLTLNTGGTLTVRVTDESGKPINWAWVSLDAATGQDHGAQTNAQGVATINFIEPGDYTLRVSAQGQAAPATAISIRDGANETTIAVRKPNCARITAVTPGSQAAKIGLQVGDLIVEYNGEKINSFEDVGRVRRKYDASTDVTITVDRNGQLMTFNLKGGQIGIDGESAVR